MNTTFATTIAEHGLVPQVEILYPPVQPFQLDGHAPVSDRKHIAMLGRFFAGRQSKGQGTAISIFRSIHPYLPAGTKLLLIGNLHPGHRAYVNELKRNASGLPVVFVISKSSKEVQQHLQTALVQWHATGINIDPEADPASCEHFGIAVAEGMTAGTIPVVINRGGVPDIVEHGVNGYLAATAAELGLYTRQLFSMDPRDIQPFQHAAISKALSFQTKVFDTNFIRLTLRGFYTRSFRHVIRNAEPFMASLAQSAALPPSTPDGVTTHSSAAVIIEPRQHYALRFAVKNAMHHLPRTWAVHVYHGSINGAFARAVLSNMGNIQYHNLEIEHMTIRGYNELLTNRSFWESVRAENILLFQTDNMLLKGDIESFMQWDYIGAPWHLENERWSKMRDVMRIGVGNGGLCFRKASAVLRVIDKYKSQTTSSEQEDVFFVKWMEKEGMQIPERQVAYKFCVEVPCHDLQPSPLTADLPPMALHAAWYYVMDMSLLQKWYAHAFL